MIKPGEGFYLYVNQGLREAMCLAVIDDEALIEYWMPSGTTSLRIVPADIPDSVKYRNVGYLTIPLKWLAAMIEQDTEWGGYPQQGNWPGTVIQEYEKRSNK